MRSSAPGRDLVAVASVLPEPEIIDVLIAIVALAHCSLYGALPIFEEELRRANIDDVPSTEPNRGLDARRCLNADRNALSRGATGEEILRIFQLAAPLGFAGASA